MDRSEKWLIGVLVSSFTLGMIGGIAWAIGSGVAGWWFPPVVPKLVVFVGCGLVGFLFIGMPLGLLLGKLMGPSGPGGDAIKSDNPRKNAEPSAADDRAACGPSA
jgi:hypothetical protein